MGVDRALWTYEPDEEPAVARGFGAGWLIHRIERDNPRACAYAPDRREPAEARSIAAAFFGRRGA